MECFLNNTQSLLAAIATLAILCLFVEMRGNEKFNPNGNFIFQLIAAIGSDVNNNLSRFYNSIKSRAEDKKKEVYKRCGVVIRGEGQTEDRYLYSICEAKGRNDLKQKLLSVYKKIDETGRKILDYSGIKYQFDGKNQPKFIDHYNIRQEPRLIALMVFLTSIIFLFLDIILFDFEYIVPFTWLFLFNVIAFSFMVWNNHFSHVYDNTIRKTKRRLGVKILCGILNLLVPMFCFSLLLYLPFDYLSLILSIVCPIVIIIVICTPMFRSYRHKHEYTRTIVLKHMVYFGLSALVGTCILHYMSSHYMEYAFQRHMHFFFNPLYVQWLLYSVLLLDLIFIPLYGGYIHMKVDEWRAVRRIKKRISQYDILLNDSVEEMYSVVYEIVNLDYSQAETLVTQPTVRD